MGTRGGGTRIRRFVGGTGGMEERVILEFELRRSEFNEACSCSQGSVDRFMRLERGRVFQVRQESGTVLSCCSAVFCREAAQNARVMVTTGAWLIPVLLKNNETCCVLATPTQPAW